MLKDVLKEIGKLPEVFYLLTDKTQNLNPNAVVISPRQTIIIFNTSKDKTVNLIKKSIKNYNEGKVNYQTINIYNCTDEKIFNMIVQALTSNEDLIEESGVDVYSAGWTPLRLYPDVEYPEYDPTLW